MEDIGQLVIALLAIVIAIVQQVAKAKKKAKAKNMTGHPAPLGGNTQLEEIEDSPFSWLTTVAEVKKSTIEEAQHNAHKQGIERKIAVPATGGGYFSYDNAYSESIYKPIESTMTANDGFDGVEGGRSTVELTETKTVKGTDAIKKGAEKIGRAAHATEDRKDFDLREAVIYSEILKAKYMDY